MVTKAAERKPVSVRRAATRETLLAEYIDVVRYQGELKWALEAFDGPLPQDSPFRYTQMSVGDAIIAFLERSGKAHTIQELVDELNSGNAIWGTMRGPADIVAKAVGYYIKQGQLAWADAKHTKVKLPKK